MVAEDGRPIPGLYAAGNDAQSVMGSEYPGAGSQVGSGMTFGWAAARHAAGEHLDDGTDAPQVNDTEMKAGTPVETVTTTAG